MSFDSWPCPPPTPGVVLEQSAWTIDRPGGGLWLGMAGSIQPIKAVTMYCKTCCMNTWGKVTKLAQSWGPPKT